MPPAPKLRAGLPIKPKTLDPNIIVKDSLLLSTTKVEDFKSEFEKHKITLQIIRPISNRSDDSELEIKEGNFIFEMKPISPKVEIKPQGEILKSEVSLFHKKIEQVKYQLGVSTTAYICFNKKLGVTDNLLIVDNGKGYDFYKNPINAKGSLSLTGWSKDCKTLIFADLTCSYPCSKKEILSIYKLILK